MHDYISKHNVPCEWRTLTACRAFWSESLFKTAQAEVAKLKKDAPSLGSHVKIVGDKDSLKEAKVPSTDGVTLTHPAASVWPYKLITFILEKLVKEGSLNLQTLTPVTKVSKGKDGKPTLETARGTITANNVILATNGYTSHLLPDLASIIVPVRGQMTALFPPKGAPRLKNSYGFVGCKGQSAAHDDYLNQRPFEGVPNPAGHYMFGGGRSTGSLPAIGVSDDDVVDEGSAEYLRKTLLEVMELGGETEGVTELKASHQWTGIMAYSRDDMPWVGKVPVEGLEGFWIAGAYTGGSKSFNIFVKVPLSSLLTHID